MKEDMNTPQSAALKSWLVASSLMMALGAPAHANHHEGAHDHHAGASPAGAEAAAADEFVHAEVKSVDRDKGKLMLKHEAIRKYNMNGMTMGFRVADPTWLDSIAVGDKVRFMPDRVNGQYVIIRIEKLP